MTENTRGKYKCFYSCSRSSKKTRVEEIRERGEGEGCKRKMSGRRRINKRRVEKNE